MTTASLPVSRYISVTVNLSPKAASEQNLSTLLVLSDNSVIDTVERMREYDDLDGLAIDFGTTSPTYKAAALWFEQAPQPTSILVGRWAQSASHGQLICGPLSTAEQAMANFTVIDDGAITLSVNGAPQTLTNLDFTGDTNLNGVASTINSALSGATVQWDANSSRFEFTSTTTGTSSAVSFLTDPSSGDDLVALLKGLSTSSGAYTVAGLAAEVAADCVAIFDLEFGQKWYAVTVLGLTPGSGSDSDKLLDVSEFVEGADTKHLHGITTQEGGVVVPATSSDIASLASALKYKRTLTQYSSKSPYAVCSALGRLLTVDFNGNSTAITLAYKQEPGIVAESLNSTQANSCIAKHCLVMVNVNNGTAIIEPNSAVMASGDYCDDITDTDWLAVALQTEMYNELYTSTTKVPQTDKGVHRLVAVAELVCSQGVNNGVLAEGTWTAGGFGALVTGQYLERGFYVYANPVATQPKAAREARKSPTIQIAAKLAGAVHTVDVLVNVNR